MIITSNYLVDNDVSDPFKSEDELFEDKRGITSSTDNAGITKATM